MDEPHNQATCKNIAIEADDFFNLFTVEKTSCRHYKDQRKGNK